jgi:DNA-binding CsgD family transcriptional regulator/antitoxin component of RelBE/YafQ-DinJ toxin-antitoxin module
MATHSDAPAEWRGLLAVGVIAGDLSALTISRFAGVTRATATHALAAAAEAGVLVDGRISDADAVRLVAELPAERTASVHAAIASHLMGQGPSRLLEALEHARAAGDTSHVEEIAAIAEQAGHMSLSVSDYESARSLFALADESGVADAPSDRARRLGAQAVALEGLGRVPDARDACARAFDLAELAGDADLAADLAVAYAFPADWYAGDVRAGALLQRADALGPDKERAIQILAARAIVEMRIPIDTTTDHQTAWVTRSSVARPLADEALAVSTDASDHTRLLALLAWRTTHRAPQFLARRREVSADAVDLAQRLRLPGRQVDAAVMLAVDALESGDRPQYERALSVLRWVADRDGNPRLRWHAYAAAAGAAFIDEDLESANHYRTLAREAGSAVESPGWLGAEYLFAAEDLLARDDRESMAIALGMADLDGIINPIGLGALASIRARTGDPVRAEVDLRHAVRGLDEESSLLLTASVAAEAAALLDVPDIVAQLTAVLTPYADHVAVDSNGWWCTGPVTLALATLAHAADDDAAAERHLDAAQATAHRTGDVQALGRIDALRRNLRADAQGTRDAPVGALDHDLTERELQVLRMLVDGATNPEIARALSYSPSTIRNDVTSIYRKFGVRSRPEAAARASALGLV